MPAFFSLIEAKEPLKSSQIHFLSPNLNLTSFNLGYLKKLELTLGFMTVQQDKNIKKKKEYIKTE